MRPAGARELSACSSRFEDVQHRLPSIGGQLHYQSAIPQTCGRPALQRHGQGSPIQLAQALVEAHEAAASGLPGP